MFQWARELGKKTSPVPVDVPLHSCEHYYMVTKPQEGIDRMMPGTYLSYMALYTVLVVYTFNMDFT